MTPNKVLERLEGIEIKISSGTLHNYVKWELINAPITKSMGRAKGRVTKYDNDAFAKIYAAYMLMNGGYRLHSKHVKEVYFNAMRTLSDATYCDMLQKNMTNTQPCKEEHFYLIRPVSELEFLWIFYYCQALETKFYSKANIDIASNKNLSGEPILNITVDRPLEDNLKYGIINYRIKDYPATVAILEVSDYNRGNLSCVNFDLVNQFLALSV